MLNLNISYFLQKNLKSLYLFTICNIIHLQDGNTKVKLMLRILETFHVVFEINRKVGSGYGGDTEHSLTEDK